MGPHSKSFPLPSSFTQSLPSTSRTDRFKRRILSHSFKQNLDRVNVLGDDDNTYGHTGCVNALSWARDGELLLSGGDDTTVRIWRIDPSNTSQEYPFICHSVIHTGHQGNIFNAHMLPYSARIATVAGDGQVRVFDVEEARGVPSHGRETEYRSRESCIHILRCHQDRVKRIVTEDSPDLFLSVGEDGYVRQHDLRTPHNCRTGSCPAPLVKVNHELSTLALSPLAPHQFVVAGESSFGYLFDRRHAGRFLQEEWGMVPGAASDEVTTCVRRFGRRVKTSGQLSSRREHITGARMSAQNSHEVLLSYSADAVYLYSTRDEPEKRGSSSQTPIIPPNAIRRKLEGSSENLIATNDRDSSSVHSMDEDDCDSSLTAILDDADDSDNNQHDDVDDNDDFDFDDTGEVDEANYHPKVPIILPRLRFSGARNVDTIKDVNFLGPDDEYVTSGSDDGNFFIWHKATGTLHGLFEGDSSVVNVIEGHPHLPLVAVSGMDTTVKLFAPVNGRSGFSKLDNAARIMETNARRSRTWRYDFAALVAEARAQVIAEGVEEALPRCTNQ